MVIANFYPIRCPSCLGEKELPWASWDYDTRLKGPSKESTIFQLIMWVKALPKNPTKICSRCRGTGDKWEEIDKK